MHPGVRSSPHLSVKPRLQSKLTPKTCSVCSLAGKLRTAHVTRERALQQQERVLAEKQEQRYNQLVDTRLEEDRQVALAAEQEHAWQRRLEGMKAREMLDVRFC